MNPMKPFRTITRLLAPILAVVAVAFVPLSAKAQAATDDGALPFLSNATFAATSTNATWASSNYVFAPVRSSAITLQTTLKLTGAGTTAIVLKFDSSVDRVKWATGTHSVTITPAGTSEVTDVENVTIGAIPYLRLSSVENPNSATATNVAVKWLGKRGQ